MGCYVRARRHLRLPFQTTYQHRACMKMTAFRLTVCTFVLALVAAPCSATGARSSKSESEALKPVSAMANGVAVEVDPRVELMAVIQLLDDYPVLTAFESPYRSDAKAYFAGFSKHSAVTTFDRLASDGFAFDAVPKFFASLTNPPNVELNGDVPSEAIERAGGIENLKQFAPQIAEFASESDFSAFYRAHKGTYRTSVDSTLKDASTAVGQLEDYLGVKFPAARIVVSPLLHDGGFAMRGGRPDAQAFVGPVRVRDGFPDFGDKVRLGRLIWHEFSHTVVNPLTSQAKARVATLEVTEPGFRAMMRKHAYEDWETIVNESIIRAIEVRLAERQLGSDAAKTVQADQLKRGFVHVPRLVALLHEYESNRKAYPTLAEFYPELLTAFREPIEVPNVAPAPR